MSGADSAGAHCVGARQQRQLSINTPDTGIREEVMLGVALIPIKQTILCIQGRSVVPRSENTQAFSFSHLYLSCGCFAWESWGAHQAKRLFQFIWSVLYRTFCDGGDFQSPFTTALDEVLTGYTHCSYNRTSVLVGLEKMIPITTLYASGYLNLAKIRHPETSLWEETEEMSP